MAIRVRCECGRNFTAAKSSVGKRVRCPSCGRPTAVSLQRARTEREEEESHREGAAGSSQKESEKGVFAGAAALATKAETASESFDSPSRYGRSTLVTAGIALGILVCTAPLARGGMDAGPLAVLAIGLALLAGIMMAACLIKLAMESLIIVDRPKAAVAALAYFQALGQGRWEVAWDCLSSVAKDGGELVRPAIPALDLEGSRVSLFCAEHLAEYWSDLVGVGGMRTRGIRSMGTQVTSVREVSEGVAVVFVRLDVHLELASARLGGSARRSREVLSSRNSIAITGGWPAYRRNGRWFLLAAGFPAGARITRLG